MSDKLTREQIITELAVFIAELRGCVSFEFNEQGLATANKFADRIMALVALSPEQKPEKLERSPNSAEGMVSAPPTHAEINGMTCDDEGCPHYGIRHSHPTAQPTPWNGQERRREKITMTMGPPAQPRKQGHSALRGKPTDENGGIELTTFDPHPTAQPTVVYGDTRYRPDGTAYRIGTSTGIAVEPQPEAQPSAEALERVAKALCLLAHPARTIDEAVSPNVKLYMRFMREAEVAIDAYLASPDAGMVSVPLTHAAADAFWKYWKENGETHKHGYYESTWGAINAALRQREEPE